MSQVVHRLSTVFLPMTPVLRARIEATIEALVGLLDAVDGETDFEDDELGEDDDPAELDDHDEDGGDHEPDLGWTCRESLSGKDTQGVVTLDEFDFAGAPLDNNPATADALLAFRLGYRAEPFTGRSDAERRELRALDRTVRRMRAAC